MFVRIWFEPLQQKPDKRKINFIPLVCCVSSYMAEQADAVFVDVVVGCCKYAEVNIYQWRGRELRMRQHEPTQNEDISLLVTHFQHDNKFSMGNQMKFSLPGAIYELGEYISTLRFCCCHKKMEVLGWTLFAFFLLSSTRKRGRSLRLSLTAAAGFCYTMHNIRGKIERELKTIKKKECKK